MSDSALPNALTIAVLAAIESLLSCVVADGMINGKHRSDMELVAQGAGNIASALFGGFLPRVLLQERLPILKMEEEHNCRHGPLHHISHCISCFNAICRNDSYAYHCNHSIYRRIQYVPMAYLCELS